MNTTHFILDIDGTLTDGSIYIGSDGHEYKKFQAKDGLLLRALPSIGFQTVFLTGRNSKLTEIRAEDLHISFVLQGVSNKAQALMNLFTENAIDPLNTVYIGDDLNDYAAMKLCGFKACPADAAQEIRDFCNYISPYNGGHGAVRDICEYILKRDGKYRELLAFYGI